MTTQHRRCPCRAYIEPPLTERDLFAAYGVRYETRRPEIVFRANAERERVEWPAGEQRIEVRL